MRYRVHAQGRIVEGCLFNIFANGRQEAAFNAAKELCTRYKGIAFSTEKCTRTNIILVGNDNTGDMCVRAFIAPFPIPED